MAVPKTGVFRRKSGLPRRADEAEAGVRMPLAGTVEWVVAPAPDVAIKAYGVGANTAATNYPVTAGIRSCRVLSTTGIVVTIPVPAPLPYITAHVVKPQGIGLLFSYLMGLADRAAAAVHKVPSHLVYCVAAAVLILPTAVCNSSLASPGGIFPFRICREPVAVCIKITGYRFPISIIFGTG